MDGNEEHVLLTNDRSKGWASKALVLLKSFSPPDRSSSPHDFSRVLKFSQLACFSWDLSPPLILHLLSSKPLGSLLGCFLFLSLLILFPFISIDHLLFFSSLFRPGYFFFLFLFQILTFSSLDLLFIHQRLFLLLPIANVAVVSRTNTIPFSLLDLLVTLFLFLYHPSPFDPIEFLEVSNFCAASDHDTQKLAHVPLPPSIRNFLTSS